MALTYRDAGVNISSIKKSQARIGRIISRTHKAQKEAKIAHGFGHYAGIVEIRGGTLLATHTDGVGTKVMVANRMKKYGTVGVDCVAMNVNDIICIGATPVSFVDYIAANKNDERIIAKIVQGLARGAKKGTVPIVGGETAIMPDLFGEKGFAFDLAGMVVGLVPKKRMILGDKIRAGDVIIGAYSSGLHSNGYSLARRALQKFPLGSRIRGIGVLGDALLAPTQIYVRPVLEAVKRCEIHGLAHITGGSFTKLLRLKNIGFDLDALPRTPPIMQLIEDQGVKKTEMYKTFNMGIGFCMIAPANREDVITSIFKKHGIKSRRIGSVISGKGVFVDSEKIA